MRYLLQHGLEASAMQSPDAIAVVDGTRTVTYRELDEHANRLANMLLALGVTNGDRVGLFLDKSLESLIGIYGALKAGAAYVPLDPQAPATRLAYILADCGIRHLVSGPEKADTWPKLMLKGPSLEHLLVLGGDGASPTIAGVAITDESAISREPSTRPETGAIALDLAYILYTSGSTGVPKGVMLSHENGLAFVRWAVDEFGVSAEDRLSSHAPLHFDLSIFDLFAASEAGAELFLVPPETSYFPIEVARFIDQKAITVWYSVPSILNMVLHRGNLEVGSFPKLRTILFAGEVFPTKYLRRLMTLLPHVRFCNLYGPTETNVCTWYDVDPIPEDQVDPIPIGRAISGAATFVVTEDGRRADGGEIGELYVRGPTVMQGYWGDYERTARSLVPNPFVSHARDLMYRTGDLVRERPDGHIQLLGRRDHQIKTRGYRVELGDIENALFAHPAVKECAVVAIPDDMVTNRIKAFVAVSRDVDRSALMQFCSQRLPRHMIPEAFEIRDALPKTSTGKIDRQALMSSA